jgi:hypothetical protein
VLRLAAGWKLQAWDTPIELGTPSSSVLEKAYVSLGLIGKESLAES